MAASLVGGAAVGAVFGELLKAVLEMKDKALMFRPTLECLTTTLDSITAVIKEIGQHNNELGRPKEELEYLIRKMDEGTKLVYKCSKISKFNFTARIRHQEQLAELVESLVRFFMVNMQAQISRDVKETLLKVNRIHSAVNKRSRSFVRTDSSSEEVDSSAMQPADEDAMEDIISQLPNKQGSCRTEKSGSSISDCDRTAINALLEKLANGDIEQQRGAAGELRLLAKRNADIRVCIAEAGAIPPLVGLLSSSDPRTQEQAVTALLNLSIDESNKGTIVNAGAIPDIVDVLKSGGMEEARENAAATLFSLSVLDENKVAIGAAGAIPALIKLLCEGTPRGKKDAATAIFNLSIYQGNKARAVKAGIVAPLMRFLKDAGGGMVDDALGIMALLASHHEGRIAIGQAEPIPILVEVIRTGSPRNREDSAVVLWSLCTGDRQQLKLSKELGAEAALQELSENGTVRAKSKATSILKLLQWLEECG